MENKPIHPPRVDNTQNIEKNDEKTRKIDTKEIEGL
jgi:hypothetical protein